MSAVCLLFSLLGHLKTHDCLYMREKILMQRAINVIQNSACWVTSRHINCLYMREKILMQHAINVIQNSVCWVTSRHINCLYMRESNTHAINVTQNLM